MQRSVGPCKDTQLISLHDTEYYRLTCKGIIVAGAGPYKIWEKQPLCDEHGEASSSGAEEDPYTDKEHSASSVVKKKTLRYLIWFNAALFIFVVVGGTLLVRNPARSSA